MPLLTCLTGNVFSFTSNCYCKLIVNNAKVKFSRRQFSKILNHNHCPNNARFLSTEPLISPKSSPYIAYDELLLQRRLEARRSIIVEIQKEKMCEDVFAYCTQFGDINKIFHYTTYLLEYSQRENKHFVLIEFKDQKHVDNALSASTHVNYEQIMPAYTTMLWFRDSLHSQNKKKITKNQQIKITKNSCSIIDFSKQLAQTDSISHQMMLLYDSTKLNDFGTRLRFYTAYQIEQCFKGLFPYIAVLPFGSSVNSFGKQGCDLDLSLNLDYNNMEKATSKLIYQTKYFSLQEKLHVKRMMEVIADCMKIFLPGVSNVKKILEARVPIIKFDHLLCGLECDLSTTNLTAYYMSELLYMFGEIDWRVRPLTFTIRKWAGSVGLTNKTPGPWITNFSLTLMVIFFFQQKKILPSLNDLKSKAAENDVRIADSHVDCTFLRDITKLPKTTNMDSLENLLLEFFYYYSSFDFSAKAISIRIGKPIIKPEKHPLYISNPLEINLNVSRNVNADHVYRLLLAMRNAIWLLQTAKDNSPNYQGLISLFENKKS